MNTFKKIGLALTGLCLTVGTAAFVTACGEKEPEARDVNYTIVIRDQDGDLLEGVGLSVSLNDEEVASGATNAEGQLTGTLKEGTYTLTMDAETMTGFIPDSYEMELVIDADQPTVTIEVEDVVPNGTQDRPYVLTVDENGVVETTLKKNEPVYYVIYRTAGRYLTFENVDGIVITLGGESHTTTASGDKLSVRLDGDASDMFSGTAFQLNYVGAETEITATMTLASAPGTQGNPYVAELGKDITASVTGQATVYYTFKATSSGTLTVSSASAKNNIMLYNETTSTMTDYTEGGASVSVAVTEGDVIQINVQALDVTNATEVNEIVFSLTIA